MFGSKMPNFSTMGQSFIDKMSKGTGTNMVTTTGGGNTALASPLLSMKEVFLEIRDNTAQTVELLKTAVMGDAAQNKRDKLSRGDTDVDEKPNEKGPGILSRVGKSIKGATSSFFGSTLGKLALAAGGFALLKIFGDDAIGPLAELIKSIKQGKIGENISSAYKYIKGVGVDAFEMLKVNTILFIDGVKKIMGIIEGAYKAVESYVMSFDTDNANFEDESGRMHQKRGDGRLDGKELIALRQDMIDKAVGFVSDLFIGLIKAVGFGLLTSTLFIRSVKSLVGSSAIAEAVGGKKGKRGGIGKLGKMGKIGLLGRLGLVGIIASGVVSLIDAAGTGYADAIEDDITGKKQSFNFKEFVAGFLGGDDPDGGLFNAFSQGLKGAAIGGTSLLAWGLLAGAPLGPIGMGMGRVAALAIGGIIGFVGGLSGSEKIKKFMEGIGDGLMSALDTVGNFFANVFNGLKTLVTEGSFMAGYSRSDIDKKQKQLEKLEKRTGINTSEMTLEQALATVDPKDYKTTKDKIRMNNQLADIRKAFELSNTISGDVEGLPDLIQSEIDMVEAKIKDKTENPGPKNDTVLKSLKERLLKLQKDKLDALKFAETFGMDPTAPGNIATGNLSQYSKPKIENSLSLRNKPGAADLTPSMFAMGKELDALMNSSNRQPMMIANNNNNNNNSASETFLTGNLQAGRPEQANKIIAARGSNFQ